VSLGAKSLYSERFHILFVTSSTKNTLLLQSCRIIRNFLYFSLAKELHLTSIIFILSCKSMLNAVELYETTQYSSIALDCLLLRPLALRNLLQFLHASEHLHVNVSVFSLVLRQKVFEVRVYGV
jgi:hypothetical protein